MNYFLKPITAIVFIVFIITSFPLYGDEVYTKEILIEGAEVFVKNNQDISDQPKIALVLSGGGARGLVHLGAIEVLEKNNIRIDLIVGTSIGSVIGGLYASGYTCNEITQILKSVNWDDIYRDSAQRTTLFPSQIDKRDRYLISVRFNGLSPYIPSSFTPGQKILTFLSEQLLKARYQVYNDFDDLKISFRAVATDLVSGKQIIMKNGNLAEAINASLAVPLLFSAIEKDSMLLVDGGLLSNLPVQAALDEGAQKTIAVDATSRLREKDDVLVPWKLVDQATTIMSANSTTIDKQKADVVIQPVLEKFPSDQFDDIDQLIEIGKQAAEKEIERIKQVTGKTVSLSDSLFYVDSISIKVNNQPVPINDFPICAEIVNTYTNRNFIINAMDSILQDGYYQSIYTNINPRDTVVSISCDLTEFASINNIFIIGNNVISGEQIRDNLSIKLDDKLNYIRLQNDIKNIITLYRQNGYSLASIKNIEWNDQTGTLSIYIDEGIINEIEVEGNETTKRYVIDREFKYQYNNVFNWKPIQQSIQNVYATNLFERVNVDVVKTDSSTNLVVKVHEKSPIVARLGGKYDNERRMQAYIELSHENIWGTSMQADFLARLGMRDGYVGLGIIEDRIFLSNYNFGFKVYHNWQINPAGNPADPVGHYREERTGFRIQLGRQLRRLGQLIAEFRQENIEDETYDGDFDINQTNEIRTIRLQASSDKRDRRDFPTTGIYNYWAWESGNRLVLETGETYTKALINLEGYYTFRSYHTWHLKLFVGIGDLTLPFSENFRLGGLHSFFGLMENEYYGRQLFSANAEYRYRLPFKMGNNNLLINDAYLLIRYDFAGIWNEPEYLFTSDDFFSALGGAIAFDTFLGPLYLGYGRTTRGTDAAYISIGLDF
ncbi:MAG: patatin-like phospholipase family protein [Calditrichaceae bacterium]|nr:patatin-like phospholipase family protein [Calditrichaceae bacterium]